MVLGDDSVAMLINVRFKMKAEIHPQYTAVKVTCSCGSTFETRSTLTNDDLSLDVCSQCHPFYTGKQKLVDTAGRVEKFNQRYKARKKTEIKSD